VKSIEIFRAGWSPVWTPASVAGGSSEALGACELSSASETCQSPSTVTSSAKDRSEEEKVCVCCFCNSTETESSRETDVTTPIVGSALVSTKTMSPRTNLASGSVLSGVCAGLGVLCGPLSCTRALRRYPHAPLHNEQTLQRKRLSRARKLVGNPTLFCSL